MAQTTNQTHIWEDLLDISLGFRRSHRPSGPCGYLVRAPRAGLSSRSRCCKKNIPGDSEARGGVRFSRALPAALVKFKRLGWQTASFLTLALGSSLRLMDYRSEPGRLTVILARSLKRALIYYQEKRRFWILEDMHLPLQMGSA